MIKTEYAVKDGKKGCITTIEGSTQDITLDILSIFEALSTNETLELVLLTCIDDFLSSSAKKLLNKKGDK